MCGCLSSAPQACALTGNRTGDLLVCRLALNPLSEPHQLVLKIIFYCYSITNVPIFPPLLSPAPPSCPPLLPQSIPTLLSMSMGHSYMVFVQALSLLSTIIPSTVPSGHCQSVPCFHACGSILFVSLFVHQIALINEIIGYLSVTNWLISLSVIFSSSNHAVATGKGLFFLLCSISFCKCITVF